jgi:hypothetical protein
MSTTTFCSPVQERAQREKRSAGEVLSDLVRQALTGQHQPTSRSGASRYGFRPLPLRGATVTDELIDRLRENEPG